MGTKQGCTLSPFLFLLAFDYIIKGITEFLNNEGINVGYADDYALLTRDLDLFERAIEYMKQLIIDVNLNLNTTKTVVMVVDKNREIPRNAPALSTINGFTQVEEFRYLGYYINNTLNFEKSLNKIQTKQLMVKYRTLLMSKIIPIETKRMVIQQQITPKALSNAQMLGILMWRRNPNDPAKNWVNWKLVVRKTENELMSKIVKMIHHLPNTNTALNIVLYQNLGLTLPHAFCLAQGFKTIIKLWENRHNINTTLSTYMKDLIFPPIMEERILNNQERGLPQQDDIGDTSPLRNTLEGGWGGHFLFLACHFFQHDNKSSEVKDFPHKMPHSQNG